MTPEEMLTKDREELLEDLEAHGLNLEDDDLELAKLREIATKAAFLGDL